MNIVVDPALEEFFTVSMRLAIPILLAALGGIYNERAGVLNIGMEGMMIGGALSAFVVTYYAGSTALGIVGALLLGAVFGLIIGYFTIPTLAGDQVIVGIAFNLLMLGITSFVYRAFFAVGTERPQVEGLSTSRIAL